MIGPRKPLPRSMLYILHGLEKVFGLVDRSSPFLTFVSDKFAILWQLWGMFSSLGIPILTHFRISILDTPSPLPVAWVWLFHLHGRTSWDEFERTPPYILAMGGIMLVLVLAGFC